jgi:hypothetical protein
LRAAGPRHRLVRRRARAASAGSRQHLELVDVTVCPRRGSTSDEARRDPSGKRDCGGDVCCGPRSRVDAPAELAALGAERPAVADLERDRARRDRECKASVTVGRWRRGDERVIGQRADDRAADAESQRLI